MIYGSGLCSRSIVMPISAIYKLLKNHTYQLQSKLVSQFLTMASTIPPRHVIPHITREDFKIGFLEPESYSLRDISDSIISHLGRTEDERTPRQLEGIVRYKYHGTRYPGGATDLRFPFKWGRCDIAIKIIPSYGRPLEKVSTYLGYLLHEMSHAVFEIYSCHCDDGCGDEQDGDDQRGGHGLNWTTAALVIGRACQYTPHSPETGFLSMLLDLGIYDQLALALQGGCSLPNESELRRTGIDIYWVLLRVKSWRRGGLDIVEPKRPSRKERAKQANGCIVGQWNDGREGTSWQETILQPGGVKQSCMAVTNGASLSVRNAGSRILSVLSSIHSTLSSNHTYSPEQCEM